MFEKRKHYWSTYLGTGMATPSAERIRWQANLLFPILCAESVLAWLVDTAMEASAEELERDSNTFAAMLGQ